MSDTLTEVREEYRGDGNVVLYGKDNEWADDEFRLEVNELGLNLNFDSILKYDITEGMETATLQRAGQTVGYIEQTHSSYEWPHWLFEELYHIYEHDQLRSVDDYETKHVVKPSRRMA